MVGLSALYAAAMGGSHPLAKEAGEWPSVLAVAAVAAQRPVSADAPRRRASAIPRAMLYLSAGARGLGHRRRHSPQARMRSRHSPHAHSKVAFAEI